MSEAFIKALKWYMLSLALVVGTSALLISEETGSVKPIIVVVLGYGVAYIMAIFWKGFRGKVMFASLFVFLAISIGSVYVPMLLYVLFGMTRDMNEYVTWAVTTGVVGVPIMTLVFYRID